MKHQVSFRVIQQYTVLFVPVCGILLSQFTATVVEPVVFFHFFHKKKKNFHFLSLSISILMVKMTKIKTRKSAFQIADCHTVLLTTFLTFLNQLFPMNLIRKAEKVFFFLSLPGEFAILKCLFFF